MGKRRFDTRGRARRAACGAHALRLHESLRPFVELGEHAATARSHRVRRDRRPVHPLDRRRLDSDWRHAVSRSLSRARTYGNVALEVSDAAQAREVSKKLLAQGVDALKLFLSAPTAGQLPPDAIRACVEEAHRAAKPVFAHPNAASDIIAALEARRRFHRSYEPALGTVGQRRLGCDASSESDADSDADGLAEHDAARPHRAHATRSSAPR